MFHKIEIKNYRCLEYVSTGMDRFQALIGPNASGKTTLMDSIQFVSDIISKNLDEAVNLRTNNFQDLIWKRNIAPISFAIETNIPLDKINLLPKEKAFDLLRYEIEIGLEEEKNEIGILNERIILKNKSPEGKKYRELFPDQIKPPKSILSKISSRGSRTILNKVYGGNDNYYSEVTDQAGKGWMPSFKLGSKKSTLSNLPEDETRFPVSTWFKKLLEEGTQNIMLNSLLLRKASPPAQSRKFKNDGSNLPWVVESLKKNNETKYNLWIEHIQTALPDIKNIKTIEREDDKHRYIIVCYKNGLEVPSWMVSDGTLRLLALTLPAYLDNFDGIYLIEEPENLSAMAFNRYMYVMVTLYCIATRPGMTGGMILSAELRIFLVRRLLKLSLQL
jgi:AAA15 family ATPase/GTPase